MKFDFSVMTELNGHRATVYSWTLDIEPSSALVFATGAAIALILGVVIFLRRRSVE